MQNTMRMYHPPRRTMWFPYQPAKMMWSNVDLSTWWCRCVLPVELMAGGWSMVATGLLKGPIKCKWVMAREPDYKGTHRPERRPTLHINACVRCIHCKVRTAAINASKDLINLHIELVTSRVKVCVYIYIYNNDYCGDCELIFKVRDCSSVLVSNETQHTLLQKPLNSSF